MNIGKEKPLLSMKDSKAMPYLTKKMNSSFNIQMENKAIVRTRKSKFLNSKM